MYRFLVKPKWIAFTLLCVAAVVTMVNLGFWQLRRLDERKSFNTLVEQRVEQPAVPIGELLTLPADEREWRTVTMGGAYRGGDTEQVPIAGGYLLVTPFGLDGSDTVYVDRGFIGSAEQAPAAPTDRQELTARFRRTPDAARSVADGAAYLDLVEPVQDGLSPRGLPSLDEGPHLSYAFQWFIFSVCVAIGWVLAIRRSARPGAASGSDKQSKQRRKHQAVPWQDEPAAEAAEV